MAKLLLRDPRLDPAPPFESSSSLFSSYETLISIAASKGLNEIVELLLVHPRMAGKSDGFNAALWYATSSGNCEILKLLLKDGRANPTEGQTFSMACSQVNDQVVRLYLEDGRLDPSMNNQEALIHACWYEKLNIAKILVEDPRVDLETALNRLESIPQQSFNNKRKVIDLLKTFKKKGA
ncbi:hypothetical protein BCR33DRAFT_721861 [Rhizoclosmatium globosum]|uniref:Uncharacterized protein n=1 Tax=Rhizoclosmatium globosum TaxID=329046 RepID=A0A1Y2BPF2_9FUNG|nr:hypothetical protein BCR33DRAFT_721861 [Rhizoclosmatium globosum]|eukprot:ORY36632.1 hypothetical protein BCR33DRAFT_721861 [Rhizoclosmatium globosum]